MQEYWSGLPFPPPGDLPNSGIKPTSPSSPALQADFLHTEPPGKPLYMIHKFTGAFTDCYHFYDQQFPLSFYHLRPTFLIFPTTAFFRLQEELKSMLIPNLLFKFCTI